MSTGFWKVKVANGGLTIAAGTLTISAMICLVFFATPWGNDLGNAAIPAANAGQLRPQYRGDAQSKNSVFGMNSQYRTNDRASINIDAGGSVTGSTGIVTTGDLSTKDPGKSPLGGSDNRAVNPGTPGTDIGSSPSAGTTNSADTAIRDPITAGGGTGTPTFSEGPSGNSSTGGTNLAGNSTSDGSRVKSACFGGDGHCYAEDLLKR